MGYVSTRRRGLTFSPLLKNPVGKSCLVLPCEGKEVSLMPNPPLMFVLSVLMSCSGNRVACESISVETRWLDPTYFLRFE